MPGQVLVLICYFAVCTSGYCLTDFYSPKFSPVSDWIVLLMQDNLIAELSSEVGTQVRTYLFGFVWRRRLRLRA